MRVWMPAAVALALLCACKKEPQVTLQQEVDGHYLRGTTEFLQGNYDAALEAYGEVKRLAPEDPRLPAAIGEVYLQQGKWAEAQQQYEVAVQRDPKRASSWSRLGYAQSAQGQREAAAKSLEQALALNPSDFNALEQQAELVSASDPQQGALLLQTAAKAAPEYRQGDLYSRAYKLLLASGKVADARQLLEAAAKTTAAQEVHALLAELQLRESDLAAATASFERAAQATPLTKLPDGGVAGDSTYWEIVGRLYTKLERLDDAQRAYREAVRIDDRAVLHVSLARLAFLRGDEAAARAELDQALATARGDEIRETLEVSELLADLGRKADALTLLQHHAAAEDGLRDAELQLRTAKLAHELKRPEIVTAACERAFRLDAGVIGCP